MKKKISIDPDRREAIKAALEVEERRRIAERIAAGRVARLICDARLGETEEGVIAAYKAEHPGEDKFFIVRMVYDAPEPLPDAVDRWRRSADAPPAVWPTAEEEEEERTQRAFNRPIRYPPSGLA
jgi:hypothetical protein